MQRSRKTEYWKFVCFYQKWGKELNTIQEVPRLFRKIAKTNYKFKTNFKSDWTKVLNGKQVESVQSSWIAKGTFC